MSSSKESINVDSDGGGWLSTVRSAPPGLLSPSAAARLAAKRKPDIPSFGNDNFPITEAPSITSSRYLERTVFRFGQYYRKQKLLLIVAIEICQFHSYFSNIGLYTVHFFKSSSWKNIS